MPSVESFEQTLGIRPPDGDHNSQEMILREQIEKDWEILLELNCLPTVELTLRRGEGDEVLYFLTGKKEEVVLAKHIFGTVADGITRMLSEEKHSSTEFFENR